MTGVIKQCLSFNWSGTSLGVRVGDSGNYSYTNLKGGQGDPGTSCTHSWDGTTLNITSASGTTGANLKGDPGDPGVGIGSVSLKSGSTSAGSTAIYSVKNTNNVEVGTFSVYNGSNGSNATTTNVFSANANGLAPAASDSNKINAETSVGNYYLCADGKYRKLPENAFNYRGLGTTSGTACAGDDSRLSDARVASNIIMAAESVDSSTTATCHITGQENAGKAETIVYHNTSNETDYMVVVSTANYVTPKGDSLQIICPAKGYCEVSFININGIVYARGL